MVSIMKLRTLRKKLFWFVYQLLLRAASVTKLRYFITRETYAPESKYGSASMSAIPEKLADPLIVGRFVGSPRRTE